MSYKYYMIKLVYVTVFKYTILYSVRKSQFWSEKNDDIMI